MVTNPNKEKPEAEQSAPANVTPIREAKRVADAADIESLWEDPKLGDGIVSTTIHTVTVDKPKDFFRTHPDPAYRRRCQIYIHKPEGVIDEQTFIIAPSMWGVIDEAQPCTLVTAIYRDGTPRLWAIKLPKEGKHDNETWVSARSAARVAIDKWVKLVWTGRTYKTRDAMPGYAPDPDFSKLPPFDELIRLAFGEKGVVRDRDHFIYRELFGAAPKSNTGGDDDL
jgi:hypothetical protein